MLGDAPWAAAVANLAAAAAVRPAAAAAAATALAATASQSTQTTERSGMEIDRDAFLKLLLAQMSNQDPLSPMDSEQFLSQLAQLNTLDQMWRMNENLQAFMSQQQLLQASAMIGRTVQALDDQRNRDAGGDAEHQLVSFEASVDAGHRAADRKSVV
mgnify:CR=1 FL=1